MLQRLLAVYICLILCMTNAYALSDAEYKQLLSNSSEFRNVDIQLNTIWKETRKLAETVGEDALKHLIQNQKAWIKTERDAEAQRWMQTRSSFEDAYLRTFRNRVDTLREIKTSLEKRAKEEQRFQQDAVTSPSGKRRPDFESLKLVATPPNGMPRVIDVTLAQLGDYFSKRDVDTALEYIDDGNFIIHLIDVDKGTSRERNEKIYFSIPKGIKCAVPMRYFMDDIEGTGQEVIAQTWQLFNAIDLGKGNLSNSYSFKTIW